MLYLNFNDYIFINKLIIEKRRLVNCLKYYLNNLSKKQKA